MRLAPTSALRVCSRPPSWQRPLPCSSLYGQHHCSGQLHSLQLAYCSRPACSRDSAPSARVFICLHDLLLPLCPLQLTSLQAEVTALLEAHWQAISGTAGSLKGGQGVTPRPAHYLNGLMVGAYPIERIIGEDGVLQLEQAVDKFRQGVSIAPLCCEATACKSWLPWARRVRPCMCGATTSWQGS